jgi:hypothetical protein
VDKIEVSKQELLEKLESNRADHRQIFDEALEGFRAKVTEDLQAWIDSIANGARRNVYVSHQVPSDHTADYDRAIAMVKMDIGETTMLSERDFAQYVMDDWGWQKEFVRNSYNSTTAHERFSDYLESD